MKQERKELLFVYNASDGFLNKSWDMMHKIISPKTYQCNLCTLTHGNFKEKNLWKEFRENESKNIKFTFLYKNEFFQKYNALPLISKVEFPIIFAKKKKAIEVFMSSQDLDKVQNIESLITKIQEKINKKL